MAASDSPMMRRIHMRNTTVLVSLCFFLLFATLGFLAGVPAALAQQMAVGATASCDDAESCFQSALDMEPRSVTAHTQAADLQRKVDRLRLVMERYPESIWAQRATLVAGRWLGESNPAQAAELLEDAEQYLPLLKDYIRFWRAEALLRFGELEKAAALFESIAQEVPGTLLRGPAAYRGGEVWYQAGDCSEAILQLGRALTLDAQYEGAPHALLDLADCQLREIQSAEGQVTLIRLWTDYPGTPEAKVAVGRLDARAERGSWQPAPEDLYRRAQVLLDQALYEEAADTLQEFLRRAPDHPDRDEAQYKIGLAYIRLKRYEDVRPLLEALVGDKGRVAGKSAEWLAKVYVRSGRGEELIRFVGDLSGIPLSSKQRASIYLSAGVWLEDKERLEEALEMFRRATKAGAGTSVGPKARWRVGWLEYRTGRFRDAAETFRLGISAGNEHGWVPQFLYWMGRALEREQDPRATKAYAQLCRKYPLTYYGKLVESCTEAFEAESGLNGQSGEPSAAEPTDIPSSLKNHVHYQKALELLNVAWKEEAARELTWLAQRGLRSRAVLLELSARLSEADAHHEALRLAKIYFRDYLEGGRRPAQSGLWRVAYPMGYVPVIRSHAAGSVDPYLVAALIREESLYDAKALSPAGAIGLMQLMPATARRLGGKGEDLGELRDLLFDSETNIRLGSRYLGTLVQRFSGNIIHAVAAYNAGPSAVSSWVRRNGTMDPEEFVELIPYRETRGYVKRVLRSYREYHRLQNGACAAPSLDKVC